MALKEKKRAPTGKTNKPEQETEKDRKAALRQLKEAIAKVPSDPNALSSEELQAWENALAGLANKFPFNIGKKTSEKVGQAAERGLIQTGQPTPPPAGPVDVRQPGLTEMLTPKAETPRPTRPDLAPPPAGPVDVRQPGLIETLTPKAETPLPVQPDLGPGYDPAKGPTQGTPYGPQNKTQRPVQTTPPTEGIEIPSGRVPEKSSFAETLARIRLSSAGAGMSATQPKKVTSRFQRPAPKLVQASTSISQAPSFLSPTPVPSATQAPRVAQGARERANVLSQQAQQPRSALPFLPPASQPTGPQPVNQQAVPTSTGSLQDRIRSVRIGGQ